MGDIRVYEKNGHWSETEEKIAKIVYTDNRGNILVELWCPDCQGNLAYTGYPFTHNPYFEHKCKDCSLEFEVPLMVYPYRITPFGRIER